MKRVDPSRALAIAAGLVIIALTGAAFWLSYAHLAEVALGHGLRQAPARAWAWPATLDLFIVAGELLMLRAALARRVDGWAIGLTAVGSLGSIVLNVAGVTGARDPGDVPLLDYVVAAVPPTAALLAFGALMRQVHQALVTDDGTVGNEVFSSEHLPTAGVSRETIRQEVAASGDKKLSPDPITGTDGKTYAPSRTVPVDVTTEVTVERPVDDQSGEDFSSPAEPPVPVTVPVIEQQWQPLVWPPEVTSVERPRVTAAVPAETARQVVTEVVTRTPADLRREARRLHRQVVTSGGRGVTIDQLRDEFGLSRREATELRREVVGRPAATGREKAASTASCGR